MITTSPSSSAAVSKKRKPVRLLIGTIAAASLFFLAACGEDDPSGDNSSAPSASTSASAKPSESPSPEPSVKPSDNLDAIKVKGGFGDKPKVSVKDPWAVSKTQSKVLEKGDGAKVLEDGSVTVDYVGVNGRTGKPFDSSFDRGEQATFSLTGVIAGFKKGLVGKHVGDRVLVAMTGEDGYDQMGGNPQADINVGDSLIFVVDITATTLSDADGEAVKAKKGLPEVSVDGDKPKVTIPDTDPPSKTTVQPLIKGEGAKVKENDLVTTRSTTVLWKDGKVVDDSWGERWAPDPQTGQTRLEAMQKAMVGQPVGSRLIMVFPPGTAYKNGDRTQGITKDDTVVMVVDILFTQAGQ